MAYYSPEEMRSWQGQYESASVGSSTSSNPNYIGAASNLVATGAGASGTQTGGIIASTAGGAAAGAPMGGLIGAGVGAGLGLTAGLLGARRAKKEREAQAEAQKQQMLAQNELRRGEMQQRAFQSIQSGVRSALLGGR